MTAIRCDLLVDQGEDWSVQFVIVDDAMEGSTLAAPFRMDVKDSQGSTIHSLMTADEEDPPGTIPGIVISEESGYVQLHIPKEVTNIMPNGIYFYDMFGNYDDGDAYAGTQVSRFLEGRMIVSKRITESF